MNPTLVATFTRAGQRTPCQHRDTAHGVCGRIAAPMVAAWLPYADPPAGQQPRRSCYVLCAAHRAVWERDGIPAWALAWHRDWTAEVLAALRPAAVTAAVREHSAPQRTAEQSLFSGAAING